jgi:hypothetical protein
MLFAESSVLTICLRAQVQASTSSAPPSASAAVSKPTSAPSAATTVKSLSHGSVAPSVNAQEPEPKKLEKSATQADDASLKAASTPNLSLTAAEGKTKLVATVGSLPNLSGGLPSPGRISKTTEYVFKEVDLPLSVDENGMGGFSGLGFLTIQDPAGLRVTSIIARAASVINPLLSVGDVIMTVNGCNLDGMSMRDARIVFVELCIMARTENPEAPKLKLQIVTNGQGDKEASMNSQFLFTNVSLKRNWEVSYQTHSGIDMLLAKESGLTNRCSVVGRRLRN